MNRWTRLAVALSTPLGVLVLVWAAAMLCRRFAPGAFPAVAIGGLALWAVSIYLVGRGIHRTLWEGRQTEAGPWGKLLLTALATALWFGLLAQLLSLAFPAYFRRP